MLNAAARRARLGGRRRRRRRRRGARARRARRSSPASTPTRSCARPTRELADHQQIRRALVWPEPELPRTEGTRKLKRAAIREWVDERRRRRGTAQPATTRSPRSSRSTRAATDVSPGHDARGARPELARARRADGGARGRVSDAHRRRRVRRRARASRELRDARRAGRRRRRARRPSRSTSRRGTDRWPARAIRRVSLPTWILPLARVFAWIRVEGREHLDATRRPGHLRREPSEPHGHAGDPGGAAAAPALPRSRRRWRRSSSRRTSSRSSTAGGRGSPTA